MWTILAARGATVCLRLAWTFVLHKFATVEFFLTSTLVGDKWQIMCVHVMNYGICGDLTFSLAVEFSARSKSRRCC